MFSTLFQSVIEGFIDFLEARLVAKAIMFGHVLLAR